MSEDQIEVEVIYALPLAQDVTRLRIPAGTTVAQAIQRSGVALRHPEVDSGDARVAIFGRIAGFDTVLRANDRIEILRPLAVDPKEARRRRASRRQRLSARHKD